MKLKCLTVYNSHLFSKFNSLGNTLLAYFELQNINDIISQLKKKRPVLIDEMKIPVLSEENNMCLENGLKYKGLKFLTVEMMLNKAWIYEN